MRSDAIKKGYEKAPHRALLPHNRGYRSGYGQAIHCYCQFSCRYCARACAPARIWKDRERGSGAAGGVPFEFDTIGVDDGIAMGDRE